MMSRNPAPVRDPLDVAHPSFLVISSPWGFSQAQREQQMTRLYNRESGARVGLKGRPQKDTYYIKYAASPSAPACWLFSLLCGLLGPEPLLA